MFRLQILIRLILKGLVGIGTSVSACVCSPVGILHNGLFCFKEDLEIHAKSISNYMRQKDLFTADEIKEMASKLGKSQVCEQQQNDETFAC
jgi:hypothetical protein